MAFTKRRKQPHLYRDPSVDPTKQVALQLSAQAEKAELPAVVVTAHKPSRKRAKTVKH